MLRRGLELARAQNSRGLEQRILASSIARSTKETAPPARGLSTNRGNQRNGVG
jgi:hypothetical protein